MKVNIKNLAVDMDVKSKGVEFEVRDTDGTFRGDCFVTMSGLIWCEGKTKKANGVKVSWDEFVTWMNG